MKLSSLHQSYLTRRNGSFRLDSTTDTGAKSPSSLFWLIIHSVCCLISLVLGFRFSRLVFFLLFSTTNVYNTTPPFRQLSTAITNLQEDLPTNQNTPAVNSTVISSRVVVGRHGIRIRPWPHPNPSEVMKAHQIIERVQREQRSQFGVKKPKTVIAVTTTYVRTFQTLHLTGVVHSLMLVPYDVVWIVVEAGGVTNETANIVAKSGVRSYHVGFDQKMPNSWADRFNLEAKMRARALRVVREEKLDGVVIFADDSNMHSMELFEEIQKVHRFGAVSVGILVHSGGTDESSSANIETDQAIPVQGPACNPSNQFAGWHTFNSQLYEGKCAVYIDDRAPVLPRKMEWAGFVLNSRLLWKEADDKPDWVKDLDTLDDKDIESPLSLLKDASMVEPLGNCGKQILLWWLRVEARADSKFPPGWIINPPLDITVPSKRTPWPDTPPELPSTGKVSDSFQDQIHIVEHYSTKTRTPRKRSSRRKRKHEPKVLDTQVSDKHTDRS